MGGIAYCRRDNCGRAAEAIAGLEHQTECLEDASPPVRRPVTCSAQAAKSRRYRPSEPPGRPGRNQSNATTWGRPLPSPRSQGYPIATAGEEQQTIGRAAGGRDQIGGRPDAATAPGGDGSVLGGGGDRNSPKSCVLVARRFWQAARTKWANGARSVSSNHAVMARHCRAREPLPRCIPGFGTTRHVSDGPSRHA